MRHLLSPLWVLLNAVVGLLFLLGYSAYYGYPGHLWWVELIAVGLPFLAIAVLLLFVANLIRRRPWLSAITGVLLVLAVTRIAPWERWTNGQEPSDVDLTIISFNVPQWWGYLRDAKALEMAAFFDELRPDVAALQEASLAFHEEPPVVRGAPYLTVLRDSLGMQAAGEEGANPMFTPQPVFGHVEFVEKTQRLLEHPGDDVGGMQVVRARFLWQDREVVLYNLHLRTYGRDKPWQEVEPQPFSPDFWLRYLDQYRQAYSVRNWEIDRILEMIEQEDAPVIIAGDLNSTPNNWVYRRIAEGRQDVFRVAGRGWGMTYHTRLPLVRIDYILVGPEWEIVDAYVPRVWLSDHLPVVARIRWRDDGSLSQTDP